MASKSDKERITRKQEAAAARIQEIAPHAATMVGMLDEIKVDMILLALGIGEVGLRDAD